MEDANDHSQIVPKPQVISYAGPPDFPSAPSRNGIVLHSLSVTAGIVSVLGLLAWGWAQYVSKIGPLGFLAMPFFPIAIAGHLCAAAAFVRGRRSKSGFILNGVALLLFIFYASSVGGFPW